MSTQFDRLTNNFIVYLSALILLVSTQYIHAKECDPKYANCQYAFYQDVLSDNRNWQPPVMSLMTPVEEPANLGFLATKQQKKYSDIWEVALNSDQLSQVQRHDLITLPVLSGEPLKVYVDDVRHMNQGEAVTSELQFKTILGKVMLFNRNYNVVLSTWVEAGQRHYRGFYNAPDGTYELTTQASEHSELAYLMKVK